MSKKKTIVYVSLTGRLRHNFSERDWNKGQQYARNRVRAFTFDEGLLTAKVSGSEPLPYTVSINFDELEEGIAHTNCTCPRFDDIGICKHVAAVVQAADSAGLSEKIPGTGLIDLEDLPYDAGGGPYRDDWDDGGLDNEYDEWDEEEEGFYDSERSIGRRKQPQPGSRSGREKLTPRKKLTWKAQLAKISQLGAQLLREQPSPHASTRKLRRLTFVVDLTHSIQAGRPVVVFMGQEQLKNGQWGVLRRVKTRIDDLLKSCNEEDQALLQQLLGNELADDDYSVGPNLYCRVTRCALAPVLAAEQLARLCASGRCAITENSDFGEPTLTPATWDDGPAWGFELEWTKQAKPAAWIAKGCFRRTHPQAGDERLELHQTPMAFGCGLLIRRDGFARLEPLSQAALAWFALLRSEGSLVVPEKDFARFAEEFYRSSPPHEIDLPVETRWRRVRTTPQPRVQIRSGKSHRTDLLAVRVGFLYDDEPIEFANPALRISDFAGRRMIDRDLTDEQRRIAELRALGFTQPDYYLRNEADLQLHQKKLSHAVEELTKLGWIVEAEGQLIRRPGNFNISVTSGVDWFDLNVQCDFDGVKAALPELLKAVQNGERFITLGDGTRGMLPEDWLKKYAPIAELGKPEGDSLRFLPSQAMILDALLAAQPDANVDAAFRRVREKLRSFEGVKPKPEPASFQGTLREYQRDGLGWLEFLREFGFGGCLADDMGLGKTIQVLAQLEGIRASRAKKNTDVGPSLVVAPKSLVFNWIDEAQRFTPNLKVLNHTGIERQPIGKVAADFDLVVTTYGTLRRDILPLSKIPFHYAILDEAQAIKNPSSQAAKACRLLAAQHRLVMTGTPVENHLGDLWSLFEFLNPGMLGRSSQLAMFAGRSRPDVESVELLAKALRPFLLRRTKEQVLKELPDKTEQTLYCEFEPKQRKLYNDLRDHYRALLAHKIKTVGLAKSKIHVLEALLRLRQAACHPALVDKSKAKLPSAKLDALVEQITEVIAERHKVLVFSQFTSLLALVKPALDAQGIVYEYLDGSTRDRKARVDRFQTDDACRAFLISLKAGGHGLNLTAADYVFILDPWWNPAVEMQAVDRAHRIGQTKPVFAYRLIARDTVEEKILELQKQKRTLAEAVITADENLLRTLTADDLQMLLS